MNYYRRWIGDYQRDTGHLSLIEIGAYDRLLDHVYATENPLPKEIKVLCRICRAVSAEEQAAVELVVNQFFPINEDGQRHNKRADKEISVSRTARDNGARGGRPRTKGVTGNVTQQLTGSETEQITETITGQGGGMGHPPSSNLQPPPTTLQPPPTTATQPPSVATTGHGVRAEARASRLPSTWTLPPDCADWTRTERPGWSDQHIAEVEASFRDYWTSLPGAKGRKLDWVATWRNWVRKERGNGSANKADSLLASNLAAVGLQPPPKPKPRLFDDSDLDDGHEKA